MLGGDGTMSSLDFILSSSDIILSPMVPLMLQSLDEP